jgi:Txe/YoeB family toxin of Txe-Axe toxin-antitoxin module
VISKVRPSFWRAYDRLAPVVKIRAKVAWKLFERDPSHSSLHFKKLQARNDLWSVRINEQYRAVGVRSGDTIEWIWIGTHNEFDNLFS